MKRKFLNLFEFRGGISIIYYIALFALIWYLIIPHTSIYFKNNLFSPIWNRLNEEDVILVKGESFKLSIMGINRRVKFKSTDIKVADVDIFGYVTAYRCGITFIKAKSNKKEYNCRVRVIDLNKHHLSLKVGKSSKLRIKGASLGVHWSSSNTSIAVINRFGKVTAVSKGSTLLVGKYKGKLVTCKVKVY